MREQPQSTLDELLNEAFRVREAFSTRRTAELTGEGQTYASPPCFMHELDPSYLGYLSREEMISRMNALISAERALVLSALHVSKYARDSETRNTLREIAFCSARFVIALIHHVARLGGNTGVGPSGSAEAHLTKDAIRAEIAEITQAQNSIVRVLQQDLPLFGDDTVRSVLSEMLDLHERNIKRCALNAA